MKAVSWQNDTIPKDRRSPSFVGRHGDKYGLAEADFGKSENSGGSGGASHYYSDLPNNCAANLHNLNL